MKPYIIGEAPPKNADPDKPIEGRLGKKLAALAGLSYDDFLKHFGRANLLRYRPDSLERGFVFDEKAAELEAKILLAMTHRDQVVILLGKRVAKAFGLKPLYFVQHTLAGGADFRVIPHPSDLNRQWNDPIIVNQTKELLQTIVRRTK